MRTNSWTKTNFFCIVDVLMERVALCLRNVFHKEVTMNTNKSKSEERLTKTMQRHDWYADVCQVIAEQVILLLDQVSPPYSTTFYRCAQMRSSMPHRIEALLRSASPAVKDALCEYFDEVVWPRVRNEQCINPSATYRLNSSSDDVIVEGGQVHD